MVVVPFSSDYNAADGLGAASTGAAGGLIGGRETGVLLSVPIEYCHTRTTITPDLHSDLFVSPSLQAYGTGLKDSLEEGWKAAIRSWEGGRARLYRGHDVSGHIFILTLCILFLTDQIVGVLYPSHTSTTSGTLAKNDPSHNAIPKNHATQIRKVRGAEAYAFQGTLGLLALWWWMAIMTSVYFHTPQEKLSGFCEFSFFGGFLAFWEMDGH